MVRCREAHRTEHRRDVARDCLVVTSGGKCWDGAREAHPKLGCESMKSLWRIVCRSLGGPPY